MESWPLGSSFLQGERPWQRGDLRPGWQVLERGAWVETACLHHPGLDSSGFPGKDGKASLAQGGLTLSPAPDRKAGQDQGQPPQAGRGPTAALSPPGGVDSSLSPRPSVLCRRVGWAGPRWASSWEPPFQHGAFPCARVPGPRLRSRHLLAGSSSPALPPASFRARLGPGPEGGGAELPARDGWPAAAPRSWRENRRRRHRQPGEGGAETLTYWIGTPLHRALS